MHNTWLTSDHHFFHKNVILYCLRPFASEEEMAAKAISDESVIKMNEEMISRWNSVVKPEDTVKYLGDFSLSLKALSILKRLNGNIELVAGNHDHCHPAHSKSPAKEQAMRKVYYEAGFTSIKLEDTLQIANRTVKLHHMPYIPEVIPDGYDIRYQKWRPRDDGNWLLHGHVHERWKLQGRCLNVGVDVWDFYPVHIDQLGQIIKDAS